MTTSPQDAVIIKNARGLDPTTQNANVSSLLLGEGKILKNTPHLEATSSNIPVIDAQHAYICPGLIDMHATLSHTQVNSEEGFSKLIGVTSKSGITTMMPMIEEGNLTLSPSSLEALKRRSAHSKTLTLAPLARLTSNNERTQLNTIALLKKAGAVGFCDGQHPILSSSFLLYALRYCKSFNACIIQHPQDISLAREACATASTTASWLGLPSIPSCAEDMIVARDIRLTECTGGRLHFSQISTQRSIELIRWAKERGIAVTCDTSPPYFLLNDKALENYNTAAHLFPPLRSEQDRQAVEEALVDGTIDAVSSNHKPVSVEGKKRPFALSETGCQGFATLLPSLLTLVQRKVLNLPKAISLLTQGPSSVFGLTPPTLNEGQQADFCLFSMDTTSHLNMAEHRDRSLITPFYNMAFPGTILQTWKAGQTIYKHQP